MRSGSSNVPRTGGEAAIWRAFESLGSHHGQGTTVDTEYIMYGSLGIARCQVIT